MIFIKGGFSQDLYREFHCYGNTLTLSCQSGYTISIHSAFYGRTDQRICGNPNIVEYQKINCYMDIKQLINYCNQKTTCQIIVGNKWPDPCPYTYKYAEVLYFCV